MIFVDIIQIHLKRQLNYVTQLTSGTPEILIPLCCSTTPVRYLNSEIYILYQVHIIATFVLLSSVQMK
jgi:hypothetical protein